MILQKQIGIRPALLYQEVKRLKVEFGDLFEKTETVPTECLQGVVDELGFKMNISQQKKIDIYKLAMQ